MDRRRIAAYRDVLPSSCVRARLARTPCTYSTGASGPVPPARTDHGRLVRVASTYPTPRRPRGVMCQLIPARQCVPSVRLTSSTIPWPGRCDEPIPQRRRGAPMSLGALEHMFALCLCTHDTFEWTAEGHHHYLRPTEKILHARCKFCMRAPQLDASLRARNRLQVPHYARYSNCRR